MTRQHFFAIMLMGGAVLLTSPAEAANGFRCEDQAANCVGRCANFTGGAGDYRGHQNKCMVHCDRQVNRCLINVNLRR